MKTYKQLEGEFDKKVKEIQAKCPHKQFEWMDECWAIGHYTGRRVKVCKRCNKVLERK